MPKIVFCCIFVLVFAHVFCLYSEEEEEAFDKKKGHSGCGSYLNSTNGGFNLDITNMSISTCLFHISAESKSTQLILFFKTLFLHKDDVVNVYRSDNKSDSLLDEPIRASNGSITVVLDEKIVTIELSGNNTSFIRKFEGFYTTGSEHAIPLDTSVTTIYSPIHPGGKNSSVEIKYNSAQVFQSDAFSTFVFRQFSFNSPNNINFDDGSSFNRDYHGEQIEIFPADVTSTVAITVTMTFPTNETFELKKHEVNSKCSMFKKMDQDQFRFNSPMDAPLNGSDSYECHWLFSSSDPKGKLNVQLNEMEYKSPLDILAVLDGGTEFSPPLLQATSSNLNSTKDIMIRSSGQYLWVAFKPVDFTSSVHATVSKSGGGGGYFKRNGTIKVDNSAEDTTFMLEVDVHQIVYLSFDGNESTLSSGAVVKIYDGFEQKNLLTSLKNGGIWYPVMSQTNKMLVVATGFSKSKFVADFRGENPDCHHMSTFTNENYILSKNCNATCHWVISPQDLPNSELLLNLQYISLQDGDAIEIFLLDSAKTLIGSVSGDVTYVPQIMIPSNVGALVSIARKQDKCVKDKVFLVGLSSYLPACDNTVTVDALSKFTVVSPQYPDTYPVFGKCKWNISTSKDNLVHIAFDTFKLAQNHCIKINNVTLNVSDGELPEDMVLPGNAIIEFNSGNCVLPKVAAGLKSSEGFKFNGTVADCGSILNQKASGEFQVPPNKTLCIWKVSVPESGSSNDDVNIISFAVNKKDAIGNYELSVYDGSSVRDSPMMNTTGSEVWSRTNNLIFIYKRVDPTKPSALLSIKYTTIGCNASNQCDNKLCLHPDWRCNGHNECGDFSDERNCNSVPIPPDNKPSGYSAVSFWLAFTLMFATGGILGVAGPVLYQKYQNGQYRRFSDIQ